MRRRQLGGGGGVFQPLAKSTLHSTSIPSEQASRVPRLNAKFIQLCRRRRGAADESKHYIGDKRASAEAISNINGKLIFIRRNVPDSTFSSLLFALSLIRPCVDVARAAIYRLEWSGSVIYFYIICLPLFSFQL